MNTITAFLLVACFTPSMQQKGWGMGKPMGMGMGMSKNPLMNMLGNGGGSMNLWGNKNSWGNKNMWNMGGRKMCAPQCVEMMAKYEDSDDCWDYVKNSQTCRDCDCSKSMKGPGKGGKGKVPGRRTFMPPCPKECMPPTDLGVDSCFDFMSQSVGCSKYHSCYRECVSEDEECPSECSIPEDMDEKKCKMYVESTYPCYRYKKCMQVCEACPEDCIAESDDIEECYAAMKQNDACKGRPSCGKKCMNDGPCPANCPVPTNSDSKGCMAFMKNQEPCNEYSACYDKCPQPGDGKPDRDENQDKGRMCSNECIEELMNNPEGCKDTLEDSSSCQNEYGMVQRGCMAYCEFLQRDHSCPAMCAPPPRPMSDEDCRSWREDDPVCYYNTANCEAMCDNRSGPKRGMPKPGQRGEMCPDQCQYDGDDIDMCLTTLKENDECSGYKSCHMQCLDQDQDCPAECDLPQNAKECKSYVDMSYEGDNMCYMYRDCYEKCAAMGRRPARRPNTWTSNMFNRNRGNSGNTATGNNMFRLRNMFNFGRR